MFHPNSTVARFNPKPAVYVHWRLVFNRQGLTLFLHDMANVMDSDLEVREFKLQPRHYVYFQINTFGEA